MSKLSKAITATVSGDVAVARSLNLQYMDLSVGVEEVSNVGLVGKKITLYVKLSKEALIQGSFKSKEDLYPQAIKALKRAMIEEIFGEFRVPLIEAQAAIYSQNHDQLRQILNNIEYKMFEEYV